MRRVAEHDRSDSLHPLYASITTHQPPSLTIQRTYQPTQEYALKPMDVLARRTRLAFLDTEAARAALPRVVKLMGEWVGVRLTCLYYPCA